MVKVYSAFDPPVHCHRKFSHEEAQSVTDTECRASSPLDLLERYASGHPIHDLVRPKPPVYMDCTKIDPDEARNMLARVRNDYSFADKSVFPTIDDFIDSYGTPSASSLKPTGEASGQGEKAPEKVPSEPANPEPSSDGNPN